MFDRFRKRSVTEVADRLKQSLTSVLGEQLLALIQYSPDRSLQADSSSAPVRLHVLIVLRELDLELLAKCGDAMQAVPGRELVVPMVLSHAELLASTDVFPITFLEMKRDYRVLAGKDVLVDLTVRDIHLRLRCEQELKNLLLRMQSAFLTQNHRAEAMLNSLRAANSTLLRCLRAVLQVLREPIPDEEQRMLELAASRLGLDQDVLRRVDEICNVASLVGTETISQIYGQMLVEVHRAATAVDELEDDVVELDAAES